MLNAEQWEERRNQVGASDVYYLLNFDNKTPKKLWREKTGGSEPSFFENKYTVFGNIVEEPCLKFFFNSHKGSYELDKRVAHKDIERFVSSTDGMLKEATERIPVENKTIKSEKYTKDMINKQYYTQLQAQISCAGSSHGYLIYNTAKDEDYEHPLLYEPSKETQFVHKYDRDDELIANIENRVRYFLFCIDDKIEPTEKGYKEFMNEK